VSAALAELKQEASQMLAERGVEIGAERAGKLTALLAVLPTVPGQFPPGRPAPETTLDARLAVLELAAAAAVAGGGGGGGRGGGGGGGGSADAAPSAPGLAAKKAEVAAIQTQIAAAMQAGDRKGIMGLMQQRGRLQTEVAKLEAAPATGAGAGGAPAGGGLSAVDQLALLEFDVGLRENASAETRRT
jgi:hypothetical protein